MRGKEGQGIVTERLYRAWGVAAVRARAHAREVRLPLVRIASKAQADRLLAGSLPSSSWRLVGSTPGSGQLAQLDALQWTPRLSAALTR